MPQKHAMAFLLKNLSYIEIHPWHWTHDGINVRIMVASDTASQSIAYINDVIDAVKKWSLALKSYTGNYNAWNFNIITNPSTMSPANIVVELRGDPNKEYCNRQSGWTPLAPNGSGIVETVILTSCGTTTTSNFSHGLVTSVALHELGHALGLGHAFFIKDMMCSHELTQNGTLLRTCRGANNQPYNEPTEFDINALLYVYGTDGFSEPNRETGANSIYSHKMLLEDISKRNIQNTLGTIPQS